MKENKNCNKNFKEKKLLLVFGGGTMSRALLFALVLTALLVEATPFAWIVHCGCGHVAHHHLRKSAGWAHGVWPSHGGGIRQRERKALMLPLMCSAGAGEVGRRPGVLGEALEEEERWETAIEEVREKSGWREGETFVFGYGALLSTSVFTRRCLLPSMHLPSAPMLCNAWSDGVSPETFPTGLRICFTRTAPRHCIRGVNTLDGGRRAFVRCTAPELFLTFRLKGGWSTLDELAAVPNISTKEEDANVVFDSEADDGGGGGSSSSTGSLALPEPREAHGVIIPLSKEVSSRNDTSCYDWVLAM
jgi:hypothetical protein